MQSASEPIVESLVPSLVPDPGVSLYLDSVNDPPRVGADPEPIETHIEAEPIS